MNQQILVIDDDPVIHQLVDDYLADYGFALHHAIEGQTALHMATTLLPDIVLLDLSMEEMDGLSVCRELKKDPRTTAIPVVFFSACHGSQEKTQAFRYGAVDYIDKPVTQEELQARVTAHLNHHKSHRNLLSRLEAYQQQFGPLAEPGDEAPARSSRHLERVNRARTLLEQNLATPPSLVELAHRVGTNPKRLTEDFQILYGMSIFGWFREYRLQRAAVLLRSTDLAIEQIADRVGYSSSANLTTAFKRRFQVTPGAYRNGNDG